MTTPLSALLVLSVVGCISEKGAAPSPRSPNVTLGRIQASPLNVILAVGQTVQINVTGQTLSGTPIASFDSVRYVTQDQSDTIRVRVASDGLITALASSNNNPVLLNVFAFKDNLVRADQVVLQVTPTVVPGLTLSIQPNAGDSLRLAQGSSKDVIPILQNTTGGSITNATFRLTYPDPDVGKLGCYVPSYADLGPFTSQQLSIPTCGMSVGFNQIYAVVNTGTAWVIADAMVYGVHLRDSVQYTLTNPFNALLAMLPRSLGLGGANAAFGTIALAPGGTLTFRNLFGASLGTSLNFVFDNPAALTATVPASADGDSTGNVVALQSGRASARRFMTPGRYHYTVTLNGSTPPLTGQTASGDVLIQ